MMEKERRLCQHLFCFRRQCPAARQSFMFNLILISALCSLFHMAKKYVFLHYYASKNETTSDAERTSKHGIWKAAIHWLSLTVA